MRKIYTSNGEVDYSDEGEQSKKTISEIEVSLFYSKLKPRQKIVLTYIMAGEEIQSIARFLGVHRSTIWEDIKKIQATPYAQELRKRLGKK